MLIEFTVENFGSIKNEQVFSFVAEGEKNNHESNYFSPQTSGEISILKSAAIYGPNASGKTTILASILALRDLVLTTVEYKLDENIRGYKPFRLDIQSEERPTKFEIEFLAPDLYDTEIYQRYNYKVVYNKNEFLSEELFTYKSSKPSILYIRETNSPMKWGEYLKGKKQTIENVTRENQLFLSVAGNTKDHPLNTIYRFFRDCITSFHSEGIIGGMNVNSKTRQQLVGSEADTFNEKLVQFLKAADTGITGIRVKKVKYDNLKVEGPGPIPEEILEIIKEDLSNRPFAAHDKFDGTKKIGTQEFDIVTESHGTIQLFDMAGPIIDTLQKGSSMIVDEISTSLHPDITKYIISLFHNKITNPYNAQLIFSTHDITTLTSEMLRRDQVWFTEKDKYGATSLYSLLEFGKDKVRKETNYGNWYLKGKFGALPYVDKALFSPAQIEPEVSNGKA